MYESTTWISVVILELIHAITLDLFGRVVFIGYKNQTSNEVLFVDSQ